MSSLTHVWGEGIVLGQPGTFANETIQVHDDGTHSCVASLSAPQVVTTAVPEEVEVFGEGIVLGETGTFANETVSIDDQGQMTQDQM